MITKFSPGDIVRFKSGGPAMTIVGKQSDAVNGSSYLCGWFDKEERYNCCWLCVEGIIKCPM
jgi:uncharacterized protein YodC (DUF2158 family)